MDLLAPCRSCLRCLPFFQISPPSSPRTSTTSTTFPVAAGQQALPSPDPNDSTHSSADAPPLHGQDLPASDKIEEPHLPIHSSATDEISHLQNSATTEDEGKPTSEITIAPPVSSPPSCNTYASSHEHEEVNKIPTHSELPLQVPFINDISFSASGLPTPMTPAPFGTGYNYPAGQYHPSSHIYPPGKDDSHHDVAPSHKDHGNSHVEHAISHDDHGPLHHSHNHSHHGNDDSHHGHSSSHHGHNLPPDESLPVGASADMAPVVIAHETSPPALEASNSTPGFLGTGMNHDGGENGDADATSNMGGESALIETYHSEPLVASEFPDDDDSYTHEEGLSQSSLQLGRRRRRRDNFKDQFKGISQQIKQGRHHIKQEGSKHLQTIISNINKQAQQIEQSGSFFGVPRANNN